MLRPATSILQRFASSIAPFALKYGAAGVAFVSFLDSSFVPLPEATDLAIVYLVVQHPHQWLIYATASTVGSVVGCFVLYALARRGGEAFLKRRLKEGHIERGVATFKRFGLLTIIVPAILPPPTPFKLFVLLAGVAGIGPRTFIIGTAIGRGFRYFGVAILALWYGESAIDFIQHNMATVSVWLAGFILVGGVAYIYWKKRRR